MRRRITLLAACLAATPATAQPDPSSDPELTSDTVVRRGETLREAASPAAAPAAAPVPVARFHPARPHQPERQDGEGQLLTEGTFLVDHPGELRSTPSRAWVFTPDPTETGELIRPMIVTPSQILGRLERIVGDQSSAAHVNLTGRVLLFRGQNYLLVTAIGDQSGAPIPDAPDAGPEDSGLSGAVESLIDELEAERSGVRGVISGLGSGGEAALAPVAEGRMVVRRRCRFVRLDAGELAVRFDTDESDSPIDAPLTIAPCSLLQAVEETLEIHGDAMTATVSGQTLAYAGKSFLLPTSIVIDRPSELNSRQ